MSTPQLAVEVVADLTSHGYGAAVDAPEEKDTNAFVTAWTTDTNGDVDGIAALVRRVDREAVPQPERSDDAVDEQLVPSPDEVADEDDDQGADAGATVGPGGTARHQVRPRRVWAGVALTVVGLVTVGVAMMVESWWVGAAGVVLLVVGLVLLLSGGGLYDVHATRSAAHELSSLRDGETHEGIEPGEMVDDSKAKRTAVAVDRRRRRLIGRAGQGRHR